LPSENGIADYSVSLKRLT